MYCYKPIVLLVGPAGQGEALLRGLDREIVSYKRLVQNNKQMLSSLRRRGRDRDAEPYRSASACRHTQTLFFMLCRIGESAARIAARWTNEELLLAVQGNFSAQLNVYKRKTYIDNL